MIIYKVYCKDDNYYLSYQDLTFAQEPRSMVIQISEKEYLEIIAQDYNSMIETMKDPNRPGWSEIEFVLELSYSDGSQIKTVSDRMPGVTTNLRDLKEKYSTYLEPDYRREYGIPFIILEDGLKLYLGPDGSYRLIDTIPKGTALSEFGHNENNDTWLFTEYNGQFGWIRTVNDDNKSTIYFDVGAGNPVIYLYPEKETDVHVELELTEADIYTTYPRYNNGWDVTAYPDGSLTNKANGTHHKYLFWDAVNCRMKYDLSKGFCIAGNDTESFLKEKLYQLPTYRMKREEVKNVIFRCIFGYYNTQRINSFNAGGLPPVALRTSIESAHHTD